MFESVFNGFLSLFLLLLLGLNLLILLDLLVVLQLLQFLDFLLDLVIDLRHFFFLLLDLV